MSLCTFIMDTLRQAGLPLSKTNSLPEASKHAEIQRLKEGMINIIMDSPAAFLFVHSIERFI